MTNMTSLKKFLIKTQVHEHKNTYDPYDQTIVQGFGQRYTYRVLQTIQMKRILLCVLAERAVLGSAKTALRLEYEI